VPRIAHRNIFCDVEQKLFASFSGKRNSLDVLFFSAASAQKGILRKDRRFLPLFPEKEESHRIVGFLGFEEITEVSCFWRLI
jgi:hypothetical protein